MNLPSPELMDKLRCPACVGVLSPHDSGPEGALACAACRLLYPIADGIPALLASEAQPLPPETTR